MEEERERRKAEGNENTIGSGRNRVFSFPSLFPALRSRPFFSYAFVKFSIYIYVHAYLRVFTRVCIHKYAYTLNTRIDTRVWSKTYGLIFEQLES